MAHISFANISHKECLQVYAKILENSDRKWDAAKKMSEMPDYGTSISLAIVSIEELIKALVICLDGHGFEFRKIKGMDVVFNRHQVRYVIAFVMLLINTVFEDLVAFVMHFKLKPDEIKNFSQKFKDKSFFDWKVQFFILKRMAKIKTEFKWFSKLDLFRQDGFYSDYYHELKSPLQITKIDHDQIIERLEKVRFMGKSFIDIIVSGTKEDRDPFKELRDHMKRDNVYQKIAESLSSLRRSRTSPFEHIADYFSPTHAINKENRARL